LAVNTYICGQQNSLIMISYLIWNGSPEIFSIGSFSLRWYGLLFASGFLISQQILYYMFRKENKPEKDVDTLTIYMIVATIIGARLGHVIFYQPEMLWKSPLNVILPFELNPFRFTGFTGLASHGGAIGILFALWLYSRKKKPGQNYLQTLDRIVILVALTGALIRFGNFFNSEIIGKPTNSAMGMVFINRVTDAIKNERDSSPVDMVSVKKDENLPAGQSGRVPINIYVFFRPNTTKEEIEPFMNTTKMYLTHPSLAEYVDEPVGQPLKYEVVQEKSGNLAAKISTMGIARHPAQLYESLSCIALFAFLFWYWSRYKENLPEGRIFGYFMVILWTLRFLYEFLKENQESFENEMTLNMGQILSIPLVIVGIFILIRSFNQKKTIAA
jgi:phosphatidylglycerol:prolipoprotein diacylglycerol transferase